MTIIMSEKHQVTIPKKIAVGLSLKKGSLFRVQVVKNCIRLIPLEVKTKVYTAKEYAQLDRLLASEKGGEKRVTRSMIARMEKGTI